MTPNPNIPEEIFDWLAESSFDELSSEQQHFVTTYLSSEKYDDLRQSTLLIKNLEHMDVGPVPAFNAPDASVPTWKRIITYPIPFYQVAAAILLLAIVLPRLQSDTLDQPPSQHVVKTKLAQPIDTEVYPDEFVVKL